MTMRGHSPARSRPVAGLALAAIAIVPAVAGCTIDKSQWRDFPISTAAASRNSTTTTTTTTRTNGRTVTVTEQAVVVDSTDDSGLVSGGGAGQRRSNPASVQVDTGPGTCWNLIVDSNLNTGCGFASITDVRGERAGRVIKVSGSDRIQISLLQDGQTIATDQVRRTDHYVTVRG
jgi:hypothetical protein